MRYPMFRGTTARPSRVRGRTTIGRRGRSKRRYKRRRISKYARRTEGADRYTKAFESLGYDAALATHRTLLTKTVKFPPRTAQISAPNNVTRESDALTCKGIRVNLRFSNRGISPQKIHYGFLQTRGYCPEGNRSDAEITNSFVKINFFRQYAAAGEKEINFTDNTAEHDFTYDCRKINASKYNILMHKTMVIHGTESAEQLQEKSKTIWMRLNKSIGFNSGSDQIGNKPIFFFCWYQYTNYTITAGNLRVHMLTTSFFNK